MTLHTATGPMTIPLRATTRKAKIALASPTLDFGTVVMGEESRLPITIHNGGALDCPLTITPLHETQPERGTSEEPAPTDEHGEPLPEPPVFTYTDSVSKVVVKGYDTTTVMVRFAPRRAGDAASLYRLSFGADAPDEELSVHGLGVEVPIYLEKDVIDLQCCAFEALYRENVVIHNRAKVALKVELKVPAGLRGYLEFIPSMGYVQGRSSFTASLKLRAAEELLDKCAAHVADGGVLRVPVSVAVPDQVLPVSFVLRAQLTAPAASACAITLMERVAPTHAVNG